MKYKIIVDKQSRVNLSTEKKEYEVDIAELHTRGKIYDSLVITKDEDYVMRRLQKNEYNVLNVLEEPIKEPLPSLNIELFEGDNYIYLLDMAGNKLCAEYLLKNDFTDRYVTKNEMNSAINQTAGQIELTVNQKLTEYATGEQLEGAVTELNANITTKADEITSTVSKKVGKNEIISQINQSAEQVQIDADKISLSGKEIDLTSDDITISSNNFVVDKNGNVVIFSDKGTENGAMPSLKIKNNNTDYTDIFAGRIKTVCNGKVTLMINTNMPTIVLNGDSGEKTEIWDNVTKIQDGSKQTTIMAGDIRTNSGNGEFKIPEILHGNVSITPSASNTPTGKVVSFGKNFSSIPHVTATPVTGSPRYRSKRSWSCRYNNL